MKLTPLPKCYYTPFGTVLPNGGKDLYLLEYVYEIADYLKMDRGFLREFVQRYNYRGLEPEAAYDKYKKEYYEQMEVEYSLENSEGVDFSKGPEPLPFDKFKDDFYSWFGFDDAFIDKFSKDIKLNDSLSVFDIDLDKFCYMVLFIGDYVRSVTEFVPKLNTTLLDLCKELCEKIDNPYCEFINNKKIKDSRTVTVIKNALHLYHLMLENIDWQSKSRETLETELKVLNITSILDLFYNSLDFSTTDNSSIKGNVYKQALGYKLLLHFFKNRDYIREKKVSHLRKTESGHEYTKKDFPCREKKWIISRILWNLGFIDKMPDTKTRLYENVYRKYNIDTLEIPQSLLYFDKNRV